MKRIISILMACLALAGCASFDPHGVISRHIGNSAPASGKLDEKTRAEAFDFVWNTINTSYLDPTFKGVDWKAVGEHYRPEALGAGDDRQFWGVLDKMTGELRDAHTRVESPLRYEEIRKQEGVSLSVVLQEQGGQLYVGRVGSASEAWLLGMRPGARLLSIDGLPAMEWWQQALGRARDGSTPWNRSIYANREFNTGKAGESVAVEFERPDGSRVATRIARNRVTGKPAVLGLRLSSGLGYIRFTAFHESIRRETLATLNGMRDAKGIIVDLRDNGGGSVRFAQTFASQFVSAHHDVAHVMTRTGKPVTLLFGLLDLVKPEFVLDAPDKPFSQPLVILMNTGSASASELTAAALQGIGRAHVIGDGSCGCLLGYLGYANVPGGGALAYSELGFAFRDGRQVEGVGLVPDERVNPTVADLVSGRDPQFEAAVAWLNARTTTNQATP